MAKSKGKNQWVVPVGEDKWGVRGERNERLTKITDTQGEAISEATDIAKNQGSDVIIQNRHGQIRDRDSYGNDPCPPKDTKH
jgi:hypothetical protein